MFVCCCIKNVLMMKLRCLPVFGVTHVTTYELKNDMSFKRSKSLEMF